MKAGDHRGAVLARIQAAQSLLLDAMHAASPIQGRGWAETWVKIGEHYDLTKQLWHLVNGLPSPTGHDHDPNFEP